MKTPKSLINRSKAILILILIIGASVEALAYTYVNAASNSSPESPNPSPTGNPTGNPSETGVPGTNTPAPNQTPTPTPVPNPAEFQVSNLTTTPFTAGEGEPITVSIVVTNIGDLSGSYTVDMKINDASKGTKEVTLAGHESQTVDFQVTEATEGSYTIKIGDQIGTFSITAAPPEPLPKELKISNLFINPLEAWPDQNITISVDVTNTGAQAITYKLPFTVDGNSATNVNIEIAAGQKLTANGTITLSEIGKHSANVAGLNGVFNIVPTGKHTIHIISDRPGFLFTFDGKEVTTPYAELVDIGPHTVVAPKTFVKSVPTWGAVLFTFTTWDDGTSDPSRVVDLQKEKYAVAYYTRKGSCPSLYVWNGTGYTYEAEVSDGPGWLGYVDHFQPDGSIIFSYNYPWDYIKLDKNILQPKDGYYQMSIGETSDEIFYLDSVQLVAIDHPADTDVYSTAGTYIYKLSNQGTIYTVSKIPLSPISAINGTGQNILPEISKMDDIFTSGTRWQWNNLTLNLGDLSQAKEIKLIVAATVNWPTTQSGGQNFLKYADQPGVTPSPPPYMEIKAPNGTWIPVPDNRQFPFPDVTNEVFVVNLTGLFPTNDYEIRINTYQDIRFDYIGIDTTPQQNITIQTVNPSSADFQQIYTVISNSTGNFTKYGDVTELLQAADNKFVIGRDGEGISLQFPANLTPPAEGMERDYFVFANCWFKGNGLPYMPFTVAPLPFQDMTSFPYLSNETYPYDQEHNAYLNQYNTRTIDADQQLTIQSPIETSTPSNLRENTFSTSSLSILLTFSFLTIAFSTLVVAKKNRKFKLRS